MGRPRRRRRSEPGGIVALVDLIDAHRGAFEYDWRTRFHLPLTAVGESMTWGEALRLTQQLAADPSSAVGASVAGWEYPATHEAMVLWAAYDHQRGMAWAQAGGKGRRPEPYHRPWPSRNGRRRAKPDASLTQDEIIAALRKAGHTAPLPVRSG